MVCGSSGIQDGQDVVDWRTDDGVFIARDINNPWFCVWGAVSSADGQRIEHPPLIHTNGRGVTAASSHPVTVGPHATSTLTFVISGSGSGQSDAVAVYNYLAKHHVALLAEKVAPHTSIIKRAGVRIPNQRLQLVYTSSRFHINHLFTYLPAIAPRP